MPSVGGMRRLPKSTDGPRVLRSGRRLWPVSGVPYPSLSDKIISKNNTTIASKGHQNGWHHAPNSSLEPIKPDPPETLLGTTSSGNEETKELSKLEVRNGVENRMRTRFQLRRGRNRNYSLDASIVLGLFASGKNADFLPYVVSEVSNNAGIDCFASKDTGLNLSKCSASLLFIETDRCYRVKGVSVVVEVSDSGEWVLAVKKDGRRTLCSLFARNEMRPSTFNRKTRDVIWSAENGWKLEFPNRQDWLVFKDLYKECCDHNVSVSRTPVIHVPRVVEVDVVEDVVSTTDCFSRPDSYISVTSDEVGRALVNRSANYDLDSEDEEWLKKFNDVYSAGNGHCESCSEEKLELMIDAFERAFYCCPDDFVDAEAALNLCGELGKKQVVEAVYGYWLKKRKRKQSALLRVFQGHQPVRAPVITKASLRKRRSVNPQPTKIMRRKRPCLLQGMAGKQDPLEEDNAIPKHVEAKQLARRAIESAIAKHQRGSVAYGRI